MAHLRHSETRVINAVYNSSPPNKNAGKQNGKGDQSLSRDGERVMVLWCFKAQSPVCETQLQQTKRRLRILESELIGMVPNEFLRLTLVYNCSILHSRLAREIRGQ